MTVKLVGSTSGSVSLQAPASTSGGAHRVLTLPDADGTVAVGNTGKILQVVSVDIANTAITTSSNSFVSMNRSVSITPSATTSKIFILMTGGGTYIPTSQAFGYVTVYRGSTNLGDPSNGLEGFYNTGTSYAIVPHSLSVHDSPNTTSATTYTIYARATSGTYQFLENDRPHITLTAMEIGA